MSFLRNIRKSISRSNSSTRDSTPNSRRSISIDRSSKRGDSIESKPDGLQRSETFTIDDDETILPKVKSSKKVKPIEKFGTFTKKKKSQAPTAPVLEKYKDNNDFKWKLGPVEDPDAAQDPFNFLYQQPSSLKSDLSGNSDNSVRTTPTIDYSTYRKNRVPRHLRDQLEQLKNQSEISEEIENDPDKFRTITINSFRKSFREKFLARQNEVPHNPAWFVEVEPLPDDSKGDQDKDARTDVLVFENDNYRPTSRSPVRNTSPIRNKPSFNNETSENMKSPVRATARSPVKRNETFRVERPPSEPSIRIEIKNSISPNQPSRMVPVGVAKPMPSQVVYQPFRSSRFESPARGWDHQYQHQPTSGRDYTKSGRYQTCIQITSNDPINNKEPTRIQISGNARSPLRYVTHRKPDLSSKKQTYFGDNIPKETNPSIKSRHQYIQHLDAYTYNSRPSRPTSGMINRNDMNRISLTQAIPRRSRSPIKVPWR